MKLIGSQPSLAEQVYDAIVDEIAAGSLPSGTHLVQEQIAERLGVSRQPVQQAMGLLKVDGMVQEQGKRGLYVAKLDGAAMRHHYEIRAVLDGLAARLTALRAHNDASVANQFRERAEKILALGKIAVTEDQIANQVRHDMALHKLIYEMSGNPVLARTAEPHWRFLQRAMGEILRRAKLPVEIWQQHAEIVKAISTGDAEDAERLMISHDLEAAETLHTALLAQERP